MIQIVEKTPVTTWISDEKPIKEYLRYEYEWWRQGPFRKEKEVHRAPLVKKGYFLSGFQDRVISYLDRKGMEFEFKKPDYGIEVGLAALEGIEFRLDQWQAITKMTEKMRGVWQAPTGSGKTILICALVSAFPTTTVLVIVHTETLFRQTVEELERFFGRVGRLGCGEWEPGMTISVGMIQTLSKKMFKRDEWGMVIVDEAHHVNNFKGTYAKVLQRTLAPVRFGFTATPPQTEQGRMALEGLIGPMMGRTTYEELQEKEVLAMPKVRVYKAPETNRYRDLKGGYRKVYEEGIVKNRKRNMIIIQKAKELIDQGLTVLIMVEIINHGEILLEMSDFILPGEFVFLHGETASEIKEEEKQAFQDKERRGVIATRIWSEGVNIKSIGAVVNAVGGASEIASIQRFGRGLRRTKDKYSVVLIDIIDFTHRWFEKHSLKRIDTYLEAGWIISR